MTQSCPLPCSDCGRANISTAKRCLWCGAPIINEDGSAFFEPTQADLDYVGGIERLHDPTAVRVTVSEAGIEITEIMPGTRKILIDAADLVDASVTHNNSLADGNVLHRPWWSKLRRPFSNKTRAEEIPPEDARDFTLTVTYRENGVVRRAVFQRQGGPGSLTIQILARTVASLKRLKVLKPESAVEASEG
jgi:hypothetical protein